MSSNYAWVFLANNIGSSVQEIEELIMLKDEVIVAFMIWCLIHVCGPGMMATCYLTTTPSRHKLLSHELNLSKLVEDIALLGNAKGLGLLSKGWAHS